MKSSGGGNTDGVSRTFTEIMSGSFSVDIKEGFGFEHSLIKSMLFNCPSVPDPWNSSYGSFMT